MKKIFSLILCFLMIFSICSIPAFAENNIVASGKCGETEKDNVNWTLYDSGELVISGNGNIDFYILDNTHEKKQPWYDYYDRIWCVTIKEGITGVGANAFAVENEKLSTIPLCRIDLPLSLKSIALSAVNNNYGRYIRYICYAGNEGEWNKIYLAVYNYYYDSILGWTIDSVTRHKEQDWNNSWEMLYNGEKPKPHFELNQYEGFYYVKTNEENSIGLTKCYLGEYYNGNFEWTADNGLTIKPVADEMGKDSGVSFIAPNKGDYNLKATLVSKDGKEVCSDSKTVHSSDASATEKFYNFIKDKKIIDIVEFLPKVFITIGFKLAGLYYLFTGKILEIFA